MFGFLRNRYFWIILAIIVLSLTVIHQTSLEREDLTIAEKMVRNAYTPLQRGVSAFRGYLDHLDILFADKKRLMADVKRLEEELAEYQLENQDRSVITTPPTNNPTTVDATKNNTITPNPGQLTLWSPNMATEAPVKPPIRAWDELLGIPKYQVNIFQAIAPISAIIRTFSSTIPGLIILLPIVSATAVPLRAPRKFKLAASMMALRGERALVVTEVAIALAVS